MKHPHPRPVSRVCTHTAVLIADANSNARGSAMPSYLQYVDQRHVDQVITISSLSKADGYGNHGVTATPSPPEAPFPSSYATDFDSLPLNADEPYLSDQAGHWEVRAEANADDDNREAPAAAAAAAAAAPLSVHTARSSSSSNQVLRQVCPEIGVVYRGDLLPIAVLGGVGWQDTTASLRFKLESVSAAGFYLGLRVRNIHHGPATQPLPQATRMTGLYLAIYMNGTVAVLNDNYAIQEGSAPDLRPQQDDRAPPSAAALPTTAASFGVAGESAPLPVLQTPSARVQTVPPLSLNTWYNLSLAVVGDQLAWNVDGTKGNATLNEALYPPSGQLAIGLVDYGLASIDDLAVVDHPRAPVAV